MNMFTVMVSNVIEARLHHRTANTIQIEQCLSETNTAMCIHEIVQLTGASKTGVTNKIQRMLDKGDVVISSKKHRGRTVAAYKLNKSDA